MQVGTQRHSYSSTIAAKLQPRMGHFTCVILQQCAAMGPLNNGFYVRPSWVPHNLQNVKQLLRKLLIGLRT